MKIIVKMDWTYSETNMVGLVTMLPHEQVLVIP